MLLLSPSLPGVHDREQLGGPVRHIVRARAIADDGSGSVRPAGPKKGQSLVSYQYVEALVESGDFLRARPECIHAVFVDGPHR